MQTRNEKIVCPLFLVLFAFYIIVNEKQPRTGVLKNNCSAPGFKILKSISEEVHLCKVAGCVGLQLYSK